MPDRDQRTEQATPQRVRKARKEGRFAVSREFAAAVQFAVFTGCVIGLAATWWPASLLFCRKLLQEAFRTSLDPGAVIALSRQVLLPSILPLLAAGLLIFAAGFGAHLAVTGFGVAPSKLALDFNRLNPSSRLRQSPGQNLHAFVEASLLLPVFLAALWLVVSSHLNTYLRLPLLDLPAGLREAGSAVSSLLWRSAAVLLAWGGIDLFRQKRAYLRDLRMTKQEVREEWKQNDGSPEMKMRLRRLRRELLRRRMMSEVPNATAVIVNPTHFAVALRYEPAAMRAPKVVAKGKNYLALRIRARVLEHRVPIIENRPLAQALYRNCEVGREIPPPLYRAVAEVLAYVFRLMRGRS